MTTEMALTARRFAVTLAVAGAAALGSVVIAPAASAAPAAQAQDGPASVSHRSGGNGPDAFIVMDHGKRPVFFCDPEHPKKHAKKCVDVTGPSRF